MEREQRVEIHIRDPVAVGQEEGLVAHIVSNALHSAARHRVEPRVDQRHLPGLRMPLQHLHAVVREIEGHIRGVQKIIRKILLDHILFVAEADHKVVKAVGGIVFHDVPEYRLPANLDHRLWPKITLLRNSGAEATCKNDYLHRVSSLSQTCNAILTHF